MFSQHQCISGLLVNVCWQKWHSYIPYQFCIPTLFGTRSKFIYFVKVRQRESTPVNLNSFGQENVKMFARMFHEWKDMVVATWWTIIYPWQDKYWRAFHMHRLILTWSSFVHQASHLEHIHIICLHLKKQDMWYIYASHLDK